MPQRKRREMMADEERPALGISAEKLCYLIVRAREFDATVPSEDEDGSNPTDEKAVSVLEEGPDQVAGEELEAALDTLDDEERIAVLALVWLGRDDFDADEWQDAMDEAARVHDSRETAYLMGVPQLGDLLEEGMAKLGYSCEDFEIGRL